MCPVCLSVDGTTALAEHITTTDRALARISVRPPYFDLADLTETGDGIVTARVPAAPTGGSEVGAMQAAQVARHLAILGSCAAALARDGDDRLHYLATSAHFARLSNAPASTDEPLVAEAVASWVDRRTARAFIKLSTESGQGLNMLDVEYTVLAPRMFSRLHPPLDLPQETGQPDELDQAGQRRIELPFAVSHRAEGLVVDCGAIPVALCGGHFPDYPAAPVAIVMGQLCRAAGLSLAEHLGQPVAYRVEEGRVSAQKLAAAGQHLVLHASYDQPVPGGHQLVGRAEADGELVGELTVIMSAHSQADQFSDDGPPC